MTMQVSTDFIMDMKKKATFQRPQNNVYCINPQMLKPAREEWIELTIVE